MTYSQIFKNSDLPYLLKFVYFANFASHFIKSVRDTFGVEIDLSANKGFFLFTVSLYNEGVNYLYSIAQINIYSLEMMFMADSFLIDDGNASKFNKLFLEIFNSEAK